MRKIFLSNNSTNTDYLYVLDISSNNFNFLANNIEWTEGQIVQIIDLIILHEWRAYLEKNRNIQELKKKGGSVESFIEKLYQIHPNQLIFMKESGRQLFPEELGLSDLEKAVNRSLINKATEITHCNNLFIFDDCKFTEKNKQPIMQIAQDLFHLMPIKRDIAFIAINGNKTANNPSITCFDKFLEELFILTSQVNFENNRRLHEKEGPLLIEGRTGTGKSLAAKLIASKSNRSFTSINLAALSESLLESRSRGFKRGMFTDAKQDTRGWFEMAHNGVLFLDELQSASLEVQTQLLDLLSPVSNQVKIAKIGDEHNPQIFDVKIIMAINKPSQELLSEGKLREDFFHRIRDTVNFKNLNTVFNQEKNSSSLITKLLTIYRWKSFKIDIDSLRTTDDFESKIFFHPSSELINIIRNANWEGNYRQFERFAFDIFWELDNGITIEDAARMLIDLDAKRFIQDQNHHDVVKSPDEMIVEAIEKTLIENDFNIAKSLPDFSSFKLKSRPALRNFIHNNIDKFSSRFKSDSKIISFLSSN